MRKCVSQLRLSVHCLPVEAGRHVNIERKERLCTMCKCKVGTEYHCLMECFHPILTKERQTRIILSNIFKSNLALQNLPRYTLFKYILLFYDKSILLEQTTLMIMNSFSYLYILIIQSLFQICIIL